MKISSLDELFTRIKSGGGRIAVFQTMVLKIETRNTLTQTWIVVKFSTLVHCSAQWTFLFHYVPSAEQFLGNSSQKYRKLRGH